jgi:class 3 adenylate cyclase
VLFLKRCFLSNTRNRRTKFPREIAVMIADIRYYRRLAEEDVDA